MVTVGLELAFTPTSLTPLCDNGGRGEIPNGGSLGWHSNRLARELQLWCSYFKADGVNAGFYTWNDMNEPSVFNGPEVRSAVAWSPAMVPFSGVYGSGLDTRRGYRAPRCAQHVCTYRSPTIRSSFIRSHVNLKWYRAVVILLLQSLCITV